MQRALLKKFILKSFTLEISKWIGNSFTVGINCNEFYSDNALEMVLNKNALEMVLL